MAKGNQPAAKFRLGFVSATVWKNEGNGDREFFSVVLSRSYKDGDEIKNTDQMNHADLLNAAHLLQRAEAWIADQK